MEETTFYSVYREIVLKSDSKLLVGDNSEVITRPAITAEFQRSKKTPLGFELTTSDPFIIDKLRKHPEYDTPKLREYTKLDRDLMEEKNKALRDLNKEFDDKKKKKEAEIEASKKKPDHPAIAEDGEGEGTKKKAKK